ncbi:MAG: hypothetical protein MUE88_00955 [Flavobacteriales bacterium]|jgi:hypothetical protein|nr:hypothetical protein [Flavobacteriales bacterium]
MGTGVEDRLEGTFEYPQYRKLSGAERYYVIHSARSFTELQRLGYRWLRYEVEAKVYPELARVQEMLAGRAPYEFCTALEWQRAEQLATAK